MLIGYARVSTIDQETDLQKDALLRAGVLKVFSESASSVGLRPQLQLAINSLGNGDVFVVWRLDRVARSLKDLLKIIEQITVAGASIRSLTEPLDTTSYMGMFMLQILGAVAQLERSMIRERVIAGQVAAISRGGAHGRPSSVSSEQLAHILDLWNQGQRKFEITRLTGHTRNVVDRVICQYVTPNHRKYGPNRPVLGPLLSAAK